MYTYLLINFFSVLIPFGFSFSKDLGFYKTWRYFFPAMIITLIFFIVWDVVFTAQGVWGFNPRYLSGLDLINLPVEEWLFFITIPYACVFTYAALNYHVPKDYLGAYSRSISLVLFIVLLVLGFMNLDRAYTSVTFLLTALFILIHLLFLDTDFMGRFYLAYAVCLVPFFMVNGILTGSYIEEEVVWYNNGENLGIRLFTIPVEDVVYGMLLIMMNVTFMEAFRKNVSFKRLSFQSR
jgi:lycopene cyclase domain-containing protein